MSRSRRHTPIMPLTTAKSDKPYKVAEHRKERRRNRVAFQTTLDADHPAFFGRPDGDDPWRGPKDGKQVINLAAPQARRWMRK